MRVNLLMDNQDEVRQGYLNIDPFAEPDRHQAVRDNIKSLTMVDDAEAEELIAIDVIDYFPINEVKKIIQHWISKLRHGGCITIGFADLYQVSKAINNRIVPLEEANVLLHGTQDKPWRTRRSTLSIEFVTKVLESTGLKILNKKLQSGRAIIKAERP